MVKYKSLSPPDYDVSQITAPVSLHYADNDLLAQPAVCKVYENSCTLSEFAWHFKYKSYNLLNYQQFNTIFLSLYYVQ